MKRADLRDASSTGVVIALGVVLGVGGFLIVERITRLNYQPPEFAQDIQPAMAELSGVRAHPYGNCDEARAAGDTPVYRGEPGYGAHLDRDGDGVGCEPYYGP